MSKDNKTNDLLIPQPVLGKGGMIAFVTLNNVVAPLSTDMYLPALPGMAVYFHTTAKVMNMTMVGFFFFFAIGMLIFGPVSDKLGRKRVLLAGITLYSVSCLCCAFSTSVMMLIISRIFQALGGGAMVSVSTALVKDQFTGRSQGSVLAASQVFGVLAPVLAPLIGAQLLRFFGWRATFVLLTIIAVFIIIMCCLMKETLPKENRLKENVIKSFSRLGVVLKNGTFATFLIAIVLTQIPMMAYITTSSYIYVKQFGLSTTIYSLFFAGNSLVSVIGPVLYVFLRNKKSSVLTYIIFGVSLTCGVLLLLFYDFVLMDVRMPVMNGYEATENIRSLDRKDAKTVPIIAMTADAFTDAIKRSYESGMNYHLAKPLNPDLLFFTLVEAENKNPNTIIK